MSRHAHPTEALLSLLQLVQADPTVVGRGRKRRMEERYVDTVFQAEPVASISM